MRIVIDMQGAQTESRFRGIGRYTLALARAIVRNKGKHEVILALSGRLPETIGPIRAAFDGLLPQENILIWHAPGPVMELDPGNNTRYALAELLREAFLLSLQPDIIHISSLFEGFTDDAVTSIGLFDRATPVSVTLHDLIPLLNPDHYLKPNPRYAEHYLRKVGQLRRASILLANSEFTRREGIVNLKVPESRIINVSAAIDPKFTPVNLSDGAAAQLCQKFGLTRPFILYTGGADERKNLPRLIRAFAALPARLHTTHQLLLAGKMPEGIIAHLVQQAKAAGLESTGLVFAGYVTDDELIHLYSLCKLFIFPSWHEGFGLPALEAMACGAPVIAANTASLPEVIGLDIALFDPLDVSAIANKMNKALDDDAFRHSLRQHGLRQASEFSWDKTAKHAIAGFEYAIQECLPTMYQGLISSIATAVEQDESLTDTDLLGIALCIEHNEKESQSVTFTRDLPPRLTWRIEGPFDSSYSLALVNREMARALVGIGHRVVLHSTEGPGDLPANEQFLAANPDLAKMYALASEIDPESADVTSRNLYPPRVGDMHGRLNFLHAYGWEETAFPREWVKSFNSSLQGMTVMSEHVRKIMIDNGVTIPIRVCGIGVDHWQRIIPDARFKLHARQFRFLHVSSCFPRKGADAMLQAYGQAFRAKDDVSLVIKTFANPHNEVYRWLEEACQSDTEFPDVQILEGDYSDAELKALYLQCHALVAPSRAEGFGLPMAEAMLSGLAVITTGWSGQRDFCTPETAWLVDYRFEYACTHFGLFDSVWAAPDIAHLTHVLREVYHAPRSEFELRTSLGRNLLLGNFRWSDTARRAVDSVRRFARLQPPLELDIGWVTTWGTRCGIASYSKHLIESFPHPVTILAAQGAAITEVDQANVKRCWAAGDHEPLLELKRCIEAAKISTLVIQFNFGFFDIEAFSNFLSDQVDTGHVVVVMMHATADPITQPHKKLSLLAPALSRCQRVLVHAPADLNRLKAHGLLTNVALFPHGILDHSPTGKEFCPYDGEILIASYGFFLPHKGLLQLVDAVARLRASGIQIRLLLVNAEYPVPESREAIEQVLHRIDRLSLENVVEMHTEYLSDAESLKLLSNADLIVYPYQKTGESSSAAVRFGIACGRQVAVTPLSIFDDVAPAVHYLPGQSVEDIAKGIESILQRLHDSDHEMIEKQEATERWRASHRFSKMAAWLSGIISALSKAA